MSGETTTQALDELIPMADEIAIPVTPQPSHATIDAPTGTAQSSRLTPPPTNSRAKERTPTPTYSSISTPPPTIEEAIAHKREPTGVVHLDQDDLANSSAEELRKIVVGLQAAYQEAKTNAAHFKLQYQMLEQESTAAMERMAVEARMAQHENEIIHIAEQAKAAATPVQHSSEYQDGMIPVQKDLYRSMCLEIQHLHRLASSLQRENRRQESTILNQEHEIESLTSKVNLMRDRIRANREQMRSLSNIQSAFDQTQRRVFATPQHRGQDNFAALLQASEMASQEAKPSRKKKVTMTPQRYNKQSTFSTPSRERPLAVPGSAPAPRIDAFSMPPGYISRPQALNHSIPPAAPRSEDTVSNSDRDVDSEAETDIIELQGNVNESQASRAAGLMLRSEQAGSFHEIRPAQPAAAPPKLKQTRLFGAIRKPHSDRDDERPSKKARTAAPGIGLGIVNAR